MPKEKGPVASQAFEKFQRTIVRAAGLIELHERVQEAEKDGKIKIPNRAHNSDLVRASVVLAVSAMDAYFTDRFVDDLLIYLRKCGPTKEMVQFLTTAGLDARQALIMAGMKRPMRRVRTLVQGHLDRYTTQNLKRIDKLFSTLGVRNLSKRVQGRIKRKTLLRSVELLVERRNEIVHEGDQNSHGRLQQIGTEKIAKRLKDLVLFVMETDMLLSEELASRSQGQAISK